jgi:hypothetical protein
MIVKEEEDTSLLNQSYDQYAAMCDKINVQRSWISSKDASLSSASGL